MKRSLLFSLVAVLAFASPASSEPNNAILAKAEQGRDAALKFWEQLVNIDSGTGDAEGLKAVADLAIEELRKLGATIVTEPAAERAVGDNVVATFTGTGKGKALLMAHMDTVFARGAVAARPFRIKDGRATGPGASDDKAGIVMAIAALKILDELKFKDYGRITLLLNSNEETGSFGTRALIGKLAREHDVAINLEAGRVGDGVVVSRKGSGTARVEVKGKASHAGVAPDAGRNAAMELAHQMLQLSRLGDREKGTTLNFTVVKAGDRKNVIPDFAAADADVRAFSSEEFDRVERELASKSQDKLIPDTVVTTSLTRSFPVMPRNARTEALAATAQKIYGELGKTLKLEVSGGAADASFSAGAGTPSLDGLGMIGGNAHTAEEFADVESMTPRLYLLTRLVMELSKGKAE